MDANNGNLLILPPFVSAESVRDNFCTWARSRLFAPTEFASKSDFRSSRLVFTPIWCFTANVHARASATVRSVDTTTEVTETADGRVKERKTKQRGNTQSTTTTLHETFRGIGVVATMDRSSISFPPDFVNRPRMLSFDGIRDTLVGIPSDFEGLRDFPPGSQELPMTLSRDDAWRLQGLEIAKVLAEYECKERMRQGGQVLVGSRITIEQVERVESKRFSIPVYRIEYTYKGRTYVAFMDTTTGQVDGQRPKSWFKIGGFIVGLAASTYFAVKLFQWVTKE